MYKNCLMIIHVSRFIETENNPTFSLPSNRAKHGSTSSGKTLVTRAEKSSIKTTSPSGGSRWNYRAVTKDKRGEQQQHNNRPSCRGSDPCFKLPVDDLHIAIERLKNWNCNPDIFKNFKISSLEFGVVWAHAACIPGSLATWDGRIRSPRPAWETQKDPSQTKQNTPNQKQLSPANKSQDSETRNRHPQMHPVGPSSWTK